MLLLSATCHFREAEKLFEMIIVELFDFVMQDHWKSILFSTFMVPILVITFQKILSRIKQAQPEA